MIILESPDIKAMPTVHYLRQNCHNPETKEKKPPMNIRSLSQEKAKKHPKGMPVYTELSSGIDWDDEVKILFP